MYASETIQNCKNPTGHIDTLTGNFDSVHAVKKRNLSPRFLEKNPAVNTGRVDYEPINCVVILGLLREGTNQMASYFGYYERESSKTTKAMFWS